ncbi:biotin/lipoyl-binding protein [Bacteroides sp.]|uniref:biotin/lipoyl-binding protein n=1 Tax=Bacteroides sp. TaxID=29523 RepID=UPI00258EDE2C|nr:biotin/lipoyl-binding protein [Bacteroides sp.]
MKRSIQLVALLLTVFMGSCTGGKDKAAAEHVDAKPIVKLADVKARPVDQIQDYTATVEAEVKNNIAPSSPVRIDQIFVEVGDRVSKGQKLVQMDAANLKQTKLQLDNQEIEFNRIDELYKVGGASKSEWDAYNKVELGRRMGTEYELKSGVPDNSQVVVAGQSRLVNGMEVEVEASSQLSSK